MDVGAWLNRLGLAAYTRAFADNDIDAETLKSLSADDLKELGVISLGHRKKLLSAIAALSGPQGEAGAAEPAAPAEDERRQVTVLFCDLAGYTSMTRELGAEQAHELTGRFFALADQIIERFGGTVDKHIGDCVMAVFGAPIAHGNDAERAVRTALAVREAMPRLAETAGRPMDVHIGIASGQVVAGGAGGHRRFSITGDSVNLASRLTDRAAPGEILISEAVRATLAGRLKGVDAGMLEVKGLDRPIRAWRLVDLRERPETAQRPFVGRRSELRQFEGALEACLETGSGLAIHVRGEAGIGKTRLVEEFRRRAETRGFAAHVALVLDFGAGTGRDAIRALVRSLAGLNGSSDGPAGPEAAADRVLAEGLVSAERRVYLNDLLDLAQPVELRALYDAMDNARRNRGKRETVAELIERTSAMRPQLLVVEDVHWADTLTLEQLASLAETAGRCPALLVMTSRIEGDPIDQAWRTRARGSPIMTLDLGPLRPAEAAALAGAYVDASATFARQCVERAAGNPLFLEQLMRHAEARAESGVPGSIRSLVQARLDQLRPLDKQALQAASVFGQRFSLDALCHLIEHPDYDGDILIAHLLIRPEGGDLLFAHALIRDAVYDSLLSARRRELHRRSAAWFGPRDPTLHAEHLDRAEDEAAARAYLAAARAQAASYHYERARLLVARGLELARAPEDIFALTHLQGDILHDLGAMGEALQAYQRALQAAPGAIERCRVHIGLAAVKRVTDEIDDAFAHLSAAERIAVERDAIQDLARIHYLRGNLYFPRGETERCLAEHMQSLEFARKARSSELEAAALGGLGDAEYIRGRMISAHRRFQDCIELCRRHGFGRIEVANFGMIGHTETYFRPQQVALEHALEAAIAASRVGHLRAEVNARVAAIFALAELGEIASLREQAAEVQTLIERLGARRFEQTRLLNLAKAEFIAGDADCARALAREAVEVAREAGMSFHGATALGALAMIARDRTESLRAMEEGEEVLRRGAVGHAYLRFYADGIEAALALGDFERVERYAAALLDFTRAEPLPWAEFFAARGRALAAHRRNERGEGLRQELLRLRAEGERLGKKVALAAVDDALNA